MLVVRRVYLYLTSFISLMMLLVGASNLLLLLLDQWLKPNDAYFQPGNYYRDQYSLWGAITVVGAIVWALHWTLAQRTLKNEFERGAVLRKLMIYTTLAVTALLVFFNTGGLLVEFLYNLKSLDAAGFRQMLVEALPLALIFGVGWLYYWKVSQDDNKISPEEGGAATLRRWYFYLANYFMLTVLALNLSILAQQIWRLLTGVLYVADFVPRPIAGPLGWTVVALVAWVWHWWMVQRRVAQSDDEQHAVLRKVYLYVVIIQMVAVTLVCLAFFMYNLLRYILGSDPLADSGESLLTAAGKPLLMALVYGAFWGYHALVLKWDSRLVAHEPPLQANLRRLYDYLVTAVSLAVLAVGAARLVRVLADYWLSGSATVNMSRERWSDEISLFTTLILAGGPVWFYCWRGLQRLALAEGGSEERQSVFRRIYLYLVLFASVVTLLGSTAWLIYQFLLVLGEPFRGAIVSNLSWALGITLTGAVILGYHLRVLLADLRARTATVVTLPEAAPHVSRLVHLEGPDAALLDGQIARWRHDLPKEITFEILPPETDDVPAPETSEGEALVTA